MSRVYVYAIDHRNVFHDIGEAANASNFHMQIWRALGIRHHGWADNWRWFSDRSPGGQLERLWADMPKLPRADGLAMAATYDRCWFPWALRDETVAALRAMRHMPKPLRSDTAGAVAHILSAAEPARGFTFASSLADSWTCGDEDEAARWHHHVRFGKNEHACRRCGKDDIENAAEIVAAA